MAETDRNVCICEVVEAGEVAVRGVSPLCPVHGDPRDTSVDAASQERDQSQGGPSLLVRRVTAAAAAAYPLSLAGARGWLVESLRLFQALEELGAVAVVRLTVSYQGKEVLLAEYRPEEGGSR